MTPGEQLSPADVVCVPMTAEDWPQVEAIYRAGIDTGHATFETAPPTWEAFDASRSADHRLVALQGGEPRDGAVLGWAAVSPVSTREVYAGVVEHSVYVAPHARGRGIAQLLLDELVASTEAAGIWTIQSSVFPENTSSLAMHQRAGFRTVGVRERIALMSYGPRAGQWRDTVLIERRAATG